MFVLGISFCFLLLSYTVELNVLLLDLVQDPFPLEAVCGHPWKNGEGQLSFLVHAVSASPEVFTFAHSLRKQVLMRPCYVAPYLVPFSCSATLDLSFLYREPCLT